MRLRGHCFASWPSSPTTLVRPIPRRGAPKTGKLMRSGSCSITGPVGTLCDWAGLTEDNCNTLLAGLVWRRRFVPTHRGYGGRRLWRSSGYPCGRRTAADPVRARRLEVDGQVARVSCGATPTRAQRRGLPFAKAGQPLLASAPGVTVGTTELAISIDQGLDDEVVTVSGADLSQG